jgi:CRISPR-associated protein (TIGR02710 family)
VFFVPSPETRGQVQEVLDGYAKAAGQPLGPGAYGVRCVHDAQDIQGCLSTIRTLAHEVEEWLARGADYRVVADFTAGTKCMSAALALEARRWPCVFSYVGGDRRTKDGVGIVETGSERVVHDANPWEALGYQAVDEFITLFDRRAFAAAADLARRAKEKITAPDRKRALSVLDNLGAAFDAWDRFDHAGAKQKLADVLKGANDLRAAVGADRADRILRFIEQHRDHLKRLADRSDSPNEEQVRDLLANAARRKEEGRIDDGTARLYRAIEAIAQCALATRHGIPSTERVPLDHLPQSSRSRLELRPGDDGTIKLGLQDAYALLAAFGDEVGKKFMTSELCDPQRSPLTARNRSILAHGFERVRDAVFDRLWAGALDLAKTKAEDLPTFPDFSGG